MSVPVIDLFAGPGGLGEGFASLQGHQGRPFFEIALSIEKDAVAHRTLMLRAVFRRLRGSKDVKHYYSYMRGEIDEVAFRGIPAVGSARISRQFLRSVPSMNIAKSVEKARSAK